MPIFTGRMEYFHVQKTGQNTKNHSVHMEPLFQNRKFFCVHRRVLRFWLSWAYWIFPNLNECTEYSWNFFGTLRAPPSWVQYVFWKFEMRTTEFRTVFQIGWIRTNNGSSFIRTIEKQQFKPYKVRYIKVYNHHDQVCWHTPYFPCNFPETCALTL